MRFFALFAAFVLVSVGYFSSGGDKKSKPETRAASATVGAHNTPSSVSAGYRTVTVDRDAGGHFRVDAQINGRRMDFMIDTGASVIALRESDARRLGEHPAPSDYTAVVRTANGKAKAAPVTLDRVEVGGLTVRNVRALVMPDKALGENLLGMSFLSKLRRWEYARGKLVLEQ